ncbi:kinase-like domain-containing protein [Mycena latifolia]|nr:kinase-like domain-containing protein [Mycena latifolia]
MPASNNLPDFTGQLVDDGRLRLLEVLGAGSYGVVYKALDASSPLEAPVHYAVKCLGAGSRYDKREIDLHTVCSPHPSIITLHRQFYTRGFLCVVLELAAGDLWAPIEAGVFEDNDALIKQTFLQLLDAVRYCHQRGIHHRDLKPENILCNADGTDVRIADFGLAVDDELPSTIAAGTTSYMSPESLTLRRGTETYEAYQSDVWALCIVLLNIMSGAFPWFKAGGSDPGWHSFLATPNYLSRNCPISDELHELLHRCFDPFPSKRPSLLELRCEIARMKNLFRVAPQPVATSALLTVPHALGPPSAPSTAGASFEFNPSDYPSPAISDATSTFIDLVPIRASSCAISISADSLRRAHSAPAIDIPAELAHLPPTTLEMLARLRARPPPLAWPSIDLARKYPPAAPASVPQKSSRNPLKRLRRWFKQRRTASKY